MKQKTLWSCSSCGHTQARWSGQCPLCSEWNTLQEEEEISEKSSKRLIIGKQRKDKKPLKLSEIGSSPLSRLKTGIGELDKTLGGGIVPGSLILLGGDPGIGKSTLSLQLAHNLSLSEGVVLYISGEESLEQLALRAHRLKIQSENLLFSNETEISAILRLIEEIHPKLCIIDSIQILFKEELPSSAGSVVQVRETTSLLMQAAKSFEIATIIIGHVTKSGEIAGPRILEHLVDTVLYFEGDKEQNLRLVRSVKNRFGPTDEISVFEMHHEGLKEIKNPSELFIAARPKGTSGSVIVPLMGGSRPILVEAQALVTDSYYPTPSRRATGLDPNRLQLLLAVLEKRARLRVQGSDVFVSITGGFKVNEPSGDLGIALAISSSFTTRPFDHNAVAVGEIGLSGEIRSVPRIESRIKEAIQMGFTRCIIPKKNMKGLEPLRENISICPVEWVDEAIDLCLG
jgi:DNA repair protein RadA/Sms